MKNKSTLLKIRKSKIFNILVTTGEKNPCKNILFFKKFEESLKKVSDRSERKMALDPRIGAKVRLEPTQKGSAPQHHIQQCKLSITAVR